MHPVANAAAAVAYFTKADGGYYLNGDLRQEWLGQGAGLLGLSGTPNFDHFRRLIHGLDPHTGDQLTAKLLENRIPAWDVTASIPKGVTIALERGDSRIQDALWEAARETMSDLEQYATTRIRKGGQHDDRVTGNLVAFAVEHPETRPAKSDNMPDPDRHIHMVVFNLTQDPVEGEWKAVKFRPIMDLRKWFDRRFDARMASKLTDLGYSIETKLKADKEGGKRYFSWDIRDMPDSVVKKFSRRAGEVEKLAAELGVGSATGKDKLGATSRQFKRKDLTLADYRAYWDSRVTPDEARQVAEVIKGAMELTNPLPENTADKGVKYAIDHHFERTSVMGWHDLAITAMERCMGGATPEEIEPEAKRQGALFKEGQVTTKAVLAEESRIIDFAREGKGTMRPLGKLERKGGVEPNVASPVPSETPRAERNVPLPHAVDTATSTALSQQKGRPDELKRPLGFPVETPHSATLSPEQQAVSARPTAITLDGKAESIGSSRSVINGVKSPESGLNLPAREHLSPEQSALVNHVLTSTDRMVLLVGDAGTGKTKSVRAAFDAIHCPVEMLAPSASASRDTLRSEGFSKADTVASFLLSPQRQTAVKNGVIWVDEAGLLPIRDLSRLTDVAKQQNARIILQGDPKQHRSVVRHGNMMNVLQEYAGLPVGRLTEIWRQKNKGYKAVVADLAAGKREKAFDQLANLGWVQKVDSNTPLVDDYLAANFAGKSVLAVAPTHAEGDEITTEIRARLKEEGKLGDDHLVRHLVPLNWTDAEKGYHERYDGSETMVFHRNSATFRAGQSVRIADFKPGDHWKSPSHFSVYREEKLPVAAGDTIRITANGKTADGHKLNNGSIYRVKGFAKDGGIVLDNGWAVPPEFGRLTHGYVTTSHASQGKTVDKVLIAMGTESKPAISAEQFYVSVSRGRESAKVYSDMTPEELKHAIQRTDTRRSATELMKPRKKPRVYDRMKKALAKARDRFRQLHSEIRTATRGHEQRREREHESIER
jgi:conjugative relaxase-like TrwC/TraI family protein